MGGTAAGKPSQRAYIIYQQINHMNIKKICVRDFER